METGPTEEGTVVVGRAPTPWDGLSPTAIGASLGRYVVLEEVGRGGMGRVLRAYDPKLQREVALKEVRREGLGSEGTARLVAEARAMAKLSHPNVVAVFDVEELPSGELAVVMEYVRGTTLRGWLRKEDRHWRDIVAKFIDAGRGLAAAHDAGLLHRDFKPTNVMVASAPERSERVVSKTGTGAVKVMDFGLAKTDGSSGTANSVGDSSGDALTEAGTVMGTPRYMAPEQHRPSSARSPQELTAAADQYSFCVALWEALSPDPPFSGEDLAAQKHRGPPSWSTSTVPGPVVAAIERGLAPRPRDRWPDMNALLDALDYDPSARRRRWGVGLSALAVVGLVALSTASWVRTQNQRCSGTDEHLIGVWDGPRRVEVETAVLGIEAPYATAVWERTWRDLDEYAKAWTSMHRSACEATTVRGEQSEAVMDLRMACLQRAKMDLDAAIGVLATADATVVQRAHEVVGGLSPLWRCADVERLRAEVEPPTVDQAEGVRTARVFLAQAAAEHQAGRYDAARAKLELATDTLADINYPPIQVELVLRTAQNLEALGDYDATVESFEQAVELGARTHQWTLMAESLVALIHVVGLLQGNPERALAYAVTARGLVDGPNQESALANSVAAVLHGQGKYEEAEAEFRRSLELDTQVYGSEHSSLARTRLNIAVALRLQGKYEEAESQARRAVSVWERALSPEHPDVARAHGNLAIILDVQGKYQEAEAEYRHSLELLEGALGPEHPSVATGRVNLAAVLEMRGKFEEAEAEHRRALALTEKAFGSDHPYVAMGRHNLGHFLLDRGRPGEALEHLERAWTRRQRDDIALQDRAGTAYNLAVSLWETGEDKARRQRARRLAERSAQEYRDAGPAEADSLEFVEAWLELHPVATAAAAAAD